MIIYIPGTGKILIKKPTTVPHGTKLLEVVKMADMNNNGQVQNDFFSADETAPVAVPDSQKETHVPSIVLGIFGIIGGIIIPLLGIGLGAGAIAMANKNQLTAKTGAGKVVGIVAIVISVINMILGVIIRMPQIAEQMANLG